MRYFNPLDEYAGLSPMAPTRLSADVGMEALRASHSSLVNDSSPGLLIETGETPTDDEVSEFYARWESRFKGTAKVRRPALLSAGMKATGLGFSPREMEYMQSLRWSLEDVGRAFGVPKPMLGDVERVTFSNFAVARRIFWEDTVVPQLRFYAEAINHGLVPQLGDASLRAEFDLGAVESLRESENDRAKRWQGYIGAGIMTVDEVRERDGPRPAAAGASRGRAGRRRWKGAVTVGEIEAIRCDHDGLKMAEVQDGHLILRKKHHGQTHVKIVSLSAFGVKHTSQLAPRRGDQATTLGPATGSGVTGRRHTAMVHSSSASPR